VNNRIGYATPFSLFSRTVTHEFPIFTDAACLPAPEFMSDGTEIDRSAEPAAPATQSGTVAFPLSYLLLVTLFLSTCHFLVQRQFSLRALGVMFVLCAGCLVYGRLLLRLTRLSFPGSTCLSIQLFLGYLVLNTLLLVWFLATPFSLVAGFWLLIGAGFAAALLCKGTLKEMDPGINRIPDILCLILGSAAVILWSSDSLHPTFEEGHATVFQQWQDNFLHVRLISSIGQAHGLGSLSHSRMSGSPAGLYHIASYVLPATVSRLTGSSAFDIFSSFQLPVGLFLSGLAAFSLIASFWGVWPGLAAAAGLLLLPDAYQQGFGTKFLSYNFLQQVALAGLFGVSCVAVAWLFVLHACKTRRASFILIGWLFLLASVTYKAHLFVANAFLIMIYPVIFFKGIRWQWRMPVGACMIGLFLAVVSWTQDMAGVPTLHLDGSSARAYMSELLSSYDPHGFGSFVTKGFAGQDHQGTVLFLSLTGMVSVSTFGLWLVACVVIAVLIRAKNPAAVLFFPVLVVINYIVMFAGLAMDAKFVGTPDELLHRPFVWAYFVVAAWTAGGCYAFFFGNRPPATVLARTLVALLAVGSLSVPVRFAHNLQTMPVWPPLGSFREFNSVPSGLVATALYIRTHSDSRDIIQDSESDPRLVVGALAERQDFAVAFFQPESRAPIGLRERLDGLAAFKKLSDEAGVIQYARTHGISWYLLHPGSGVGWPQSFLDKAVFCSDGFRVFHFTRE
jgi:hypothetical protein